MNTTQLALGGAAVAAAVVLTQDGGIDGLLGGSDGSGMADADNPPRGASNAPGFETAGQNTGPANVPGGAGQNTGPANTPGGQDIPEPAPSLPNPGSVGGAGQQPGPMNVPSTTAPAPGASAQPGFETAEPSGGSSSDSDGSGGSSGSDDSGGSAFEVDGAVADLIGGSGQVPTEADVRTVRDAFRSGNPAVDKADVVDVISAHNEGLRI